MRENFAAKNIVMDSLNINIKMEPFNIEELMAYDAEHDMRIFFHASIWWRSVNPFFCMPAWHLTAFPAGQSKPPLFKSLLGYLHLVPYASFYNCKYYILCMDDLRNYDITHLRRQTRQDIRRGLDILEIRPITTSEQLIREGYPVYLSWLARIDQVKGQKYHDYQKFALLIKNAVLSRKKLILGAYYQDKLIAFLLGYVIGNHAFIEKCYAMTKYLEYHPTQVLLYAFVSICKKNDNISNITLGQASFERQSLNKFLRRQGFELKPFPAFMKINEVTVQLIKATMPYKYALLTKYLNYINYQG